MSPVRLPVTDYAVLLFVYTRLNTTTPLISSFCIPFSYLKTAALSLTNFR